MPFSRCPCLQILAGLQLDWRKDLFTGSTLIVELLPFGGGVSFRHQGSLRSLSMHWVLNCFGYLGLAVMAISVAVSLTWMIISLLVSKCALEVYFICGDTFHRLLFYILYYCFIFCKLPWSSCFAGRAKCNFLKSYLYTLRVPVITFPKISTIDQDG